LFTKSRQVSGAVRAVMGALGRIYGAPTEAPTERSFLKRYSVSLALSTLQETGSSQSMRAANFDRALRAIDTLRPASGFRRRSRTTDAERTHP
jgi:hypothetical protein